MSGPQIINPYTPVVYLSPDFATVFEASRHLCVTTLGIFIWDWLLSMRAEYLLITRASRRTPFISYFLCRLSVCAYMVSSTLFQGGLLSIPVTKWILIPRIWVSVAPSNDCGTLRVIDKIFECFALSSASYLFYLRVQAVIPYFPFVNRVFSFLWLSVVAGSITSIFAASGTQISPTPFCITSAVKTFAVISPLTNSLNTMLVFLAIAFAMLAKDPHDATPVHLSARLGGLLKARDLCPLFQVFFQNEQKYYLAVVVINLLALSTVLAPPNAISMFAIPSTVLQGIMACRVDREFRLKGLLPAEDFDVTGPMLTSHITVEFDKTLY